MMMKLLTASPSPFGRKVKVVAIEKGLMERIEIVMLSTSPSAPNEQLARENPLIKIPKKSKIPITRHFNPTKNAKIAKIKSKTSPVPKSGCLMTSKAGTKAINPGIIRSLKLTPLK